MSDQPPSDAPRKRPILKLKNPPAALVPPPPPPPVVRWKCKPCGTPVPLTGEEAPADIIRCAACNARLGTAQDFADNSPKVRARRIEGAA